MELRKTPAEPVPGKFIIDPDRARLWLAKYNHNNRPMSDATVRLLVGIISRGEWRYNGEPICFSSSKRLLQGQHRLEACARANIAIATAVETGLDDNVYQTYDRQRRRSNSDFLAAKGEQNTLLMAAIIGWVWRWETDRLQTGFTPSPDEMEQTLERHPGIRSSMIAATATRRSPGPDSIACYAYYRACMSDPDKPLSFFEPLSTGEALDHRNPVMLLRKRLLHIKGSKSRLLPVELLALYTKAWNAYRQGRQQSRLRRINHGDNPPPAFPEVIQGNGAG